MAGRGRANLPSSSKGKSALVHSFHYTVTISYLSKMTSCYSQSRSCSINCPQESPTPIDDYHTPGTLLSPAAIVVVGLAEGGGTNPTPPTAATAATIAIVVIAILPAAGTITSPAHCPPPRGDCSSRARRVVPPPAAIVAGGRPLAVQLLVRASCRHGLLRVM